MRMSFLLSSSILIWYKTRSCIERVLNYFLDGVGGPLHYLASGDLISDFRRKLMDAVGHIIQPVQTLCGFSLSGALEFLH